jgi:ubiquinone/menaquinone biosynthesis C-methylase UbiE
VNKIIETYSKRAEDYDDPRNLDSCWGRIANRALDTVKLTEKHRTVADIGCGSGRELHRLAEKTGPGVRFVGVEPAAGLRDIAAERARSLPNMDAISGRFEAIPLQSAAVDYLYSVLAFHWTTDLDASVAELKRVLGEHGEMDLTFIGKHNGREFIKATTPVFFRYVKPARLIEAARMRRPRSCSRSTSTRRSSGSRSRITPSSTPSKATGPGGCASKARPSRFRPRRRPSATKPCVPGWPSSRRARASRTRCTSCTSACAASGAQPG